MDRQSQAGSSETPFAGAFRERDSRARWPKAGAGTGRTRPGATRKAAVVGVGPMIPVGAIAEAARFSHRASSEAQRAHQTNSTRRCERTRPGARTEATAIEVRPILSAGAV